MRPSTLRPLRGRSAQGERFRWAIALLTFSLACFPPPLDETGRQCDQAGRSCGSGFVCFDGVCWVQDEVDAGPDNWLINGGFERTNNDAGFFPYLWRSAAAGDIASDVTYTHEGMRSVRLFSRDGGEIIGVQTAPQQDIKNTKRGMTWCARAWARSNLADGGIRVQLLLRERENDGGLAVNQNEGARVPLTPTWVQLEGSLNTNGADRMDLRVQSVNGVNSKADMAWVDDMRLKRSPTDTCTW